jgi:hypothetical protein
VFDEQATLELFGKNPRLMREMLISFERLCTSKLIRRLQVGSQPLPLPIVKEGWVGLTVGRCHEQEAVLTGRDDKLLLHELDFLTQALQCVVAKDLTVSVEKACKLAQACIVNKQRSFSDLQVRTASARTCALPRPS